MVIVPQQYEGYNELWIQDVSKRDARLLISWWSAHTSYFYFKRPSPSFKKLYDIWRYK